MAHFAVPAHILTGKDALAEAVPYMKECGRRALIVTGKHVGKSPMMYLLKKALMEACPALEDVLIVPAAGVTTVYANDGGIVLAF